MRSVGEGIDTHLVERFRDDLLALSPLPTRVAPLGVAVSGGGDSLGLLLLAHAAFPGAISAATVDHRLRAGAEGEGRFVAAVCAGLGVPHSALALATAPRGASIQARAREARYAALGDWAQGQGIASVATAHHRDDQAETLLMRIARGAGLGGLAAIRAATAMQAGTTFVRPLLGWSRDELRAVVAIHALTPVDDPANDSPRHDRTHARRLLAATPWLGADRLAASAAHLAEAEEALAWAASELWARRGKSDADGSVTIAAADLPHELQRRLLIAGLDALGAEARTGPKLARLLATLRAGGAGTLAGIRCAGGDVWRLSVAPPRRRN